MMTTLHIVLAIVGVVLIAAIVIYNVWQERRFRREADKMFTQRRDDVMLGESVSGETGGRRGEPRIQLDSGSAEPPAPPPQPEPAPVSMLEAIENEAPRVAPVKPVAAESAPEPRARPMPTPEPVAPVRTPGPAAPMPATVAEDDDADPRTRASGLDALTEFIARFRFTTPTAIDFGPLLAGLRRIGKPVRAFGKRVDGTWEALSSHPREAFEQLEFGLQLADRGGALLPDQLDRFCRELYELAAEAGGAVTCADKEEALQQARDLDLFCMDVDVLIGLNIVGADDSRPFTSEAIHGLAGEAGLRLEADGTYHTRDDFGHALFTLANQDESPFPRDGRGLVCSGVTLLFDVPRVADGLNVFDRMTRLGFDLAWRLEGRLVDDNGRAVSEESLNRDRARLAAFYQGMERRGIPAGGERALRLFV